MQSLPKGFPQTIPAGTKILFASFPADGHFNPLTGLAMHLKSIGCDVRWYSSKHYTAKLERLGIRYYPFKRALDFDPNNLEEFFPEREKQKSQVGKLVYDMINAFILRGPEYFEDISEIKQVFDFDIMVADIAFTAIPLVKEKLMVPVISVGVMPLTETSKDLPPAGLGMTPSNSFFGRRKQYLLRFIADKFLFGKPNRIMNKILNKYGVESEGLNLFDLNIHKASLYLQSGTPGFEYDRSDLGKNIRFVGPLMPYNKQKTDQPWYDKRLRQYEKVVLVTQGTVEKDVTKLIIPAIEAFKNSDYLLIVTTGGSQTQQLRSQYPQENIIIEDFIHFDEVMPYADVYISNGGYGGVLLSIQNELPMVVAGIHEGKNEINARVGYFNLGINLKTEKPTKEQIRSSVETIMASPVYLENIKNLSREFNSYDPNALCEHYIGSLSIARKRAERRQRLEVEEIY